MGQLMTRDESFLQKIEEFLAKSGMPPTIFGRQAVGDGNFLRELRNGRSPSLRVAERVESFIATQLNNGAKEAAE